MIPRLLLAAPHKSSGKTTVTLGLCAALAQHGLRIQPFKKGPDYIDPMWLGAAAGRPCYSLDPYVQQEEEIVREFSRHAAGCDLALIEGNMGLFDSLDVEGHHSNATLAALLRAPVVLVVDVRGATRSIVPLLLGFQQFDPRIRIAGVILNKVAGKRHEQRLREAIGHYLEIPVIGAIHRDEAMVIDERHLGLIPSNEAQAAAALLTTIRNKVAAQVDLEALRAIAQSAPPLPASDSTSPTAAKPADVRIGIARDAAFGFYYPEDLARLRRAGAELVPFDTLTGKGLPAVDGLLLGGGFPETQMEALERNVAMREAIRAAIEDGMPCYAECGGMMYLSRSIRWNDRCHEMVGIIPGETVMHSRPIGRGYVHLRPNGSAPWSSGDSPAFPAHEFHYSTLENLPEQTHFAYEVVRGAGIDGRHDGYVYKNLLANYAHLRDVDGTPWCERFVGFVRKIAAQRQNRHAAQ
ncbi:MAG TPA: cobyrinate a,c-diamide synthase [Gammaproteobacteria bacterium]